MVKNFGRFLSVEDEADIAREVAEAQAGIEMAMPEVEELPQLGPDGIPPEQQAQVRVAAARLLGFTGDNGILVSDAQREQNHLDRLAGTFIRNALFAVGLRQDGFQEGDPLLLAATRWIARNEREARGAYRAYAARHAREGIPSFERCFRAAQMRLDEAVKHLESAEPDEVEEES